MRICIVTTELKPFCPGGVGVVVSNLLEQSRGSGTEVHVLLLDAGDVDQSLFAALFPEARLHVVDTGKHHQVADLRNYPPLWAYTDSKWHARSMAAMLTLKRLENEGLIFDAIEFPDWGGLAFCAAQEKKLGQAFLCTRIVVRLHSTETILRRYEPRSPGSKKACLMDLERKALRDADQIIGHLDSVAEHTRRALGFSHDEWNPRLRLSLPPVKVGCLARTTIDVCRETPIVFPAKLQGIKRPDVFIRGVVALMRECQEYHGKAILCAHRFDDEYGLSLEAMIPEDLRDRVVFVHDMTHHDRESLIASSIAVIPSAFESFCLTAYEASMLGAVVVLNEGNPAFGVGTPWKDAYNCLLFDGSPLDLARRLTKLIREGLPATLSPIEYEPNRPWWEKETLDEKGDRVNTWEGRAPLPLVSVVIPHFNLGEYLSGTLRSLAMCDYPNMEVIVIDDFSTDPRSRAAIDALEQHQGEGLRVLRPPVNLGLAGARNLAISQATGDYILTLDADDMIDGEFIGMAVRALENHREYAMVVPQCAYFEDEEKLFRREFSDYAIFIGEAFTVGFHANRFSTATALIRRSVLDKIKYNERLESWEDWDFYLRAVTSGYRIIVTNHIQFYYRKRAGSMIHNMGPQRRDRCFEQMFSNLEVTIAETRMPLTFINDAVGDRKRQVKQKQRPITSCIVFSDGSILASKMPDDMLRFMFRVGERLVRVRGRYQFLRYLMHPIRLAVNLLTDRRSGAKH